MKNLIVETQKINTFKNGEFLQMENFSCCYNIDNDRYYIVESDDNRLIAIDPINNKRYYYNNINFKRLTAKCIGIEYCSITQELFIASDSGIVICVSELDNKYLKYAEIAEFTNGLSCIKISPDHEVIVLLTIDNHVITLNSNFDILNETNLTSAEFGEKQFITVGWGKKETQFHGSEGKGAAKVKPTITGKTTTDNGLPKITWRGDGTLFAISYIDQDVNARRFKVFNREGILQYTSELVDCLEGTLSWKPSGNLIASSRKLPNKHTVAFFEKNGLLHREFILPFGTKNIKILDLIWSRDSDILCIWYHDFDTNTIIVQLWSEKNYHWYLKQTIKYPSKNPIVYLYWYPLINKDLLILSSKNSTIYTFSWTVSHSYGKHASDKAVVGVIDGDKILLTNFKDRIVPPPMAQQTLQFNEAINAISFAPNNYEDLDMNSNDFLVLLCNNQIIYCKNINESWEIQYFKKKTYNLDLQLKDAAKLSFHSIQHFFWYKSHIALCSITQDTKSSLYELNLLDIEILDEILIEIKNVQEMPGQIEYIVPSSDSKTAFIVVNSKLYKYNDRDGVQKCDSLITNNNLTRAAVKIEFVQFDTKEVILALTQKYVLYVDGKEVANNITSLFVHSEFLLLTTLQHSLICLRLDESGLEQLCTKDLTIQPWENESSEVKLAQEINIRRVERGSTLIVAVPKDAKTVLQMPRGNLECIQPRALSITIIGAFIDELNYTKAFDLMRKQRIDLNLLYDHDPSAFISNAEKFINDVKNSSWLSLFLTDLKNEDVTKTIYASSYKQYKSRKLEENGIKKIDLVCETLRVIMEKNDKDFIQPILISLVKSNKQLGLEKALTKVKELIADDNENQTTCSAEEALKYLIYMVDANVLYDVALGMYDFELVMFIAERSQKDPKEYLSFLNDLNNLDENYRKYTIDSHLKRFDSALEHIAKIPEKSEECLTFIQNHSLFTKAMKIFSTKSSEYRRIAVAYAKFLLGKGKSREAGIMFVKGENFEEALEAFKQANNWQDAIIMAMRLKLSASDMNDLYRHLANRLQESKRYEEAAIILSKYLNQLEDSVAVLCEGRHWHQALMEAYCMKREDLIETHVKPGLLEHAEFMLSQIRQHRQDFERHKDRLKVLRDQSAARDLAQKMQQLELDNEEPQQLGDHRRELSDLLSDTTSIAGSVISRSSQASRTTYRSSKNRRKHQRKLQSIKEGSVYEDLALIRSLHQLACQAYTQRDEVRAISEMLLYINSDHLAKELYIVISAFLNDISKSKCEIWPTVSQTKVTDISDSNPNQQIYNNIPQNLIEPHLLLAPEEKEMDWKLDMFAVS